MGKWVTPLLVMALARAAGPADALEKLEHEWIAAQKAKDPAKLAEILADNWIGVDWDGATEDKTAALEHLKMPGYGIESIEMGPMKVRDRNRHGKEQAGRQGLQWEIRFYRCVREAQGEVEGGRLAKCEAATVAITLATIAGRLRLSCCKLLIP
jgi:hypothetical protein